MKTSVQSTPFGKMADGTAVDLFTLTNRGGLVAKVTNYGTIITEVHVPDRSGRMQDVVLGFDNLAQYLKGHPHFGCTTGRVANRIAQGRFTLEGRTYTLARNNGPNSLHGGPQGFDKKVWKAEPQTGAAVKFTYTSPDGEEGFPGNLETTVVISLTDANELSLDYTAVTDKTTIVNLTNHSYFNLAGEGDILGHELTLAADEYTPADATSIPTGELAPVKGTPLDFTTARTVGSRIAEVKSTPAAGYDHNFVIRNGGRALTFAARVLERTSGRVMELFTTEPGVQLYTANWLDGSLVGAQGKKYPRHGGLCLETQHYPDAINQPKFPSIILRPGATYRQTTVYQFLTA